MADRNEEGARYHISALSSFNQHEISDNIQALKCTISRLLFPENTPVIGPDLSVLLGINNNNTVSTDNTISHCNMGFPWKNEPLSTSSLVCNCVALLFSPCNPSVTQECLRWGMNDEIVLHASQSSVLPKVGAHRAKFQYFFLAILSACTPYLSISWGVKIAQAS